MSIWLTHMHVDCVKGYMNTISDVMLFLRSSNWKEETVEEYHQIICRE
jgi:hypothetical protein